jgi:ribose/xylose/arabinose/galactoside ABC-type transport system permease subunit
MVLKMLRTEKTSESEVRVDSARKTRKRQTLILTSLVILILIFLAIFVDNFATVNNILNLLVQVAPIGIMACGVTFVMITGGIDISGPAVMTTAAVIGADYMAKTGDLFFGPILMLLVGASLGAINGLAVAFLRMVALVVTLSMMTISMGIATAWTSGESVVGLSPNFSIIFGRTPVIVIFLVVTVVFSFILRKTIYGRWLYYIGNNSNTARVSGIPTKIAILTAYIISGFCAGIAGIINTAALSSARPGMGPESQILDIVSAAVLGGVSVSGGIGTIVGAVIGAIFIIMINNVMNLIGVPDYYTFLIKGLIIILAMGMDTIRNKIKQN